MVDPDLAISIWQSTELEQVIFREPLINSEVSAVQGCAAKIDGWKPLIL
jgi:hypothetical protein